MKRLRLSLDRASQSLEMHVARALAILAAAVTGGAVLSFWCLVVHCFSGGYNWQDWGGTASVARWGAVLGLATATYMVPALIHTRLSTCLPIVYLGTAVVILLAYWDYGYAFFAAGVTHPTLVLLCWVGATYERRHRSTGCPQCGYSRDGLLHHVCPECGRSF